MADLSLYISTLWQILVCLLVLYGRS